MHLLLVDLMILLMAQTFMLRLPDWCDPANKKLQAENTILLAAIKLVNCTADSIKIKIDQRNSLMTFGELAAIWSQLKTDQIKDTA